MRRYGLEPKPPGPHLLVKVVLQQDVDLLLLLGLQLLDEEEQLPPLGPAQERRFCRGTVGQVGQRVETSRGFGEEGLAY